MSAPPAPWLVLHAGALGDLVLALHLALRLPGAERGLDVISRINPGDLSSAQPPIRRRSSEGLGLHWLHTDGRDDAPPPLASAIAGRRILSLLGGPDTPATDRLAELAPAALYAVDPRPDPDSERHIVHQWVTRLEAQGLLIPKCVHHRPDERGLVLQDVPLTSCHAEERRVEKPGFAGERSSPARTARPILVHPGSGGRTKCWPLARFVDVARRLRAAGHEVRFILGPAELERWPFADREALAAEYPVLAAPAPDELVRTLAAGRAFLGNDAGPTHLAALLGISTVALFGPTRPAIWRPLGSRVTVLAGDPAAGPDWGIGVDECAAGLVQGRPCTPAAPR